MKPTAEIEWLFANFGTPPTPVIAVDSGVIAPAPAAPLGSPSRRSTVSGPRGLLSREELPVVVTVAPNVIACALCRGKLGSKRVECTTCRSFVHPGCAKASGGCPSIGCGQRRARRAKKLAEQALRTKVKPAKLSELRELATPAELRELRELALAPAVPALPETVTAGESWLVDRLSLVGLFACLVTLLSCTACVAVVAMVRLAHLLGSA